MALTKEDLQAISGLLDVKLQPIDHRLGDMENRLGNMENRLGNMENRLDRLESEVSAVKKGQMEIRGDIIRLERKISDTYQLALDAWSKSTENRSWLEKGKLQA